MLLKRLEMQGFKSFADKTILDFSEGATAVVGPNGSGKSNISDAIRWVIGETRAKSLRGANMHDVIFAGTQTRKQLNYAEVSLVLDNSSHIFPLDYEEIVVTRRLFRSGESVYQINKTNCLLKNIHELFMDTGLGRDGYSIIGQGNVSQILSTKAEDRRSLFEEAAGVSKYKYRKEEAIRKLAHTEENLVRINDIASELEGQINPLKRQSEKARKYLEYYGEYKELDINLSVLNIQKNRQNQEKAQQMCESVNDELTALRKSEEETETKINSFYTKNKELDDEKNEKNSSLADNEAKVLQNENEIKIAENNIENNHATIKRIENDVLLINKRNDERREQIAKLEEDTESLSKKAEDILKSFDLMRSENDSLDDKRSQLHNEIEGTRALVQSTEANVISQREKMSGLEKLRFTQTERRDAIEVEIRSFNEGIIRTKAEIENSKKEAEIKREKHKKISQSVILLHEKINKLSDGINSSQAELGKMSVEYNSKLSKKKYLEAMESSYDGYAKSVKLILKSGELKKLSIYGTLSGLIDVNGEYVTAIETALGNALQNIVVESEEDAKAAIEFLRRNKGGRATFLPVSSVKARSMDGVSNISGCNGFVGMANELVKCDKKYEGIVKNLLAKTVIVENINDAIAMSRKFGYKFRVVTLAGDVTNAGGSMSGGSVNKQSGFLSRSNEIKTLDKEITALFGKIRDTKDTIAVGEQDKKTLTEQLSSYEPIMREYEDELLRLENTIEHLTASLSAGGGIDLRGEELSQLELSIKSNSDEAAKLLNDIRASQNNAEILKNRLNELERQYNETESDRQEKSKSIMDKTLELAAAENAIKSAKQSIEDIKNEMSRSLEEIDLKNSDKERICRENDIAYAAIREKQSSAEGLKKKSEALRTEIADIETQKDNINTALREIQSSNKSLTDRLLNLRQELSRAETKCERLAEAKEGIINHLWEEYELTYSDATENCTEMEDVKEAEERLKSLKSSIKSLGSVNMDSIEEYKAVKERFEFLSKQKADLEKSKVNLNSIIDSMEDLMKEHFQAQFGEINESFGKVFTELFGGGRGRLYLSEPDRILESGIEIEVQLPGKGMQNLSLYSGGEKSFIAIALLFAILRVKPTPFCILDEIDAALDDVNVARFATYLKNYIDSTQFIVITHRRGSMEAANILYGVTMQEKGVSKLLSLNIDEVEEVN